MRFGQGGKLRSFHADVRAAAMDAHLCSVARGSENSRKLRANRLVETHVRDYPIAKKCGHAVARAVEELIGNQKIEGLYIFLQGADRTDRNNSLDPELLHRMNVGAIIDLGGS